jgi:hypothetical protein
MAEIAPVKKTLRDEFAMAALPGVQRFQLEEILAGTVTVGDDHSMNLALMAYAIADAMMAARDK